MRVAVEQQESLALLPVSRLKAGDIIVYHLTEWQQRQTRIASGHHQYTSQWSLPQKVLDVEGQRVICRTWNIPREPPRQVPLRLCRGLKAAYRFGEGDPTVVVRREEEEAQQHT
eukprot:GHVS01000894.1.p1 GENE.GHVS01000894.1~~GHVS01000894.1.p1  ORF type:complete len:114 (+),score=27.06 GHVS01000894.1:2-343(+)